MRFRLFLAEDEEWIRRGVKAVIDWDSLDLTLVGEAGDGLAALEKLRQCQADILLTDVRMPNLDGIALAREVLKLQPMLKVIFISGYQDVEYLKGALRLGAVDYLLKPLDEAELGALLKRTIREISRQQLDQPRSPLPPAEAGPALADSLVCILHRKDGGALSGEASAFEQQLGPRVPDGVEWSVNRKSETELLAIFYYPPGMETQRLRHAMEAALDSYPGQALRASMGEPVAGLRNLYLSYNSAKSAMLSRSLQSASNLIVWGRDRQVDFLSPDQAGRERLLFAVEAGSAEDAGALARALLTGLVAQNPDASAGNLIDTALYLSMDLIRLLHRHGIPSDRYYDRCTELFGGRGLATLEAVAQWLDDFAAGVARDMSRLRESDAASAVGTIREYVEANYWKPLQLADLAKDVHLNPAYLSATFKRVTGRTFSSFLIGIRMENAAGLLRSTAINIGEVARSVGYEDVRHFSRLFKKHMQQTPSAYREGGAKDDRQD